MKVVSIATSVVLTLAAFMVASCNTHSPDKDGVQKLEISTAHTDTSSLEYLLTVWRNDSTGCKQGRISVVERGLFDSLQLDGLSMNVLLQKLGPPNRQGEFTGYLEKYREPRAYIQLMYYIGSDCEDRVVEPMAFLTVFVDKQNQTADHSGTSVR